MKNKTYSFAAALAVLLAFCLVFMMPAAADDTYTGGIVLPEYITEASFTDSNTVYDGTNYYTTLANAVNGIHGTENAVLYCKPDANVGTMTHGHVCKSLTVYGNGAYLSGGEQDFEIDHFSCTGVVGSSLTNDVTLKVYNLTGAGAWGSRNSAYTINLIFEDCQDMGKIMYYGLNSNGVSSTTNIQLTDCTFKEDSVSPCKVLSHAKGTISIKDCEFSNVDQPVALNNKGDGQQTITIEDCTFTSCGASTEDWTVPVSVSSSVEGASSVLTVSNCEFTDTKTNSIGQNADILLDYGVGVTSASISGTAANVILETASNYGTTVSVVYTETKTFTNAVAKIDEVAYTSLQDALANAVDGSEIQLLPGTISEGTIKMPASLKDVKIIGAENKASVLKDTTLMAADGNTISYEGITIDGIVFDNSRIQVTGWRNDGVTLCDWTIQNCEFKNIYDDTNSAAVHFNLAATEPVKNFNFVNNVIDGATGGSKSGVYIAATGEITFENNIINNVAFRPILLQIIDTDGTSDVISVTGNTFSGSAKGRLQIYGSEVASDNEDAIGGYIPTGTDTDGSLIVSGNIFKEITNAQQICFWGINTHYVTCDLSKNYYDVSLISSLDGEIFFNNEDSKSIDDLVRFGIFPYYNKLTEDGKIDTTSIVEPTYTITATDVGFDSVKVGYSAIDAKTAIIKNTGNLPVILLSLDSYENYDVSLDKTELGVGGEAILTIKPNTGLPVGNYAEKITVKTDKGTSVNVEVSFLVYQPSSGGSSKPVEEPEEPVVEPEVPTEEPEAGEATVETEVTDGGEIELETPTAGGSAAADEDEAKITGVVLPTGTDSEVTFVPVSEQAAPAGKETQTKKVFEINVPTYEKGKAAVIKFTMTVAELAADGKEAADVALWHFDEETGEWTKLVTSYTIVDGVVYFEAITNDFSPFAIVYEDEPANEPVDEPETPASPAPVLAVLAGLGAAVVLRRK